MLRHPRSRSSEAVAAVACSRSQRRMARRRYLTAFARRVLIALLLLSVAVALGFLLRLGLMRTLTPPAVIGNVDGSGQRARTHVEGGIPRVLHQIFLSGREELELASQKPMAHFRRDWKASCETHNPGWDVMFWDRSAGEALLARTYPWFLDSFRNLSSVVLQSDALRVFVLHAYGGLYLDLDTECFVSVEGSLVGHSLVLQAEGDDLLNNAQMASVAGHPFWLLMFRRVVDSAARGVTDPLYAAGPYALTQAYREYMRHNSSVTKLPGAHPDLGWLQHRPAGDPGPVGATQSPHVRVYALGEWFTPCNWNDWDCQARFAHSKSQLRSHSLMRRTVTNGSDPHMVCSSCCNKMHDIRPQGTYSSNSTRTVPAAQDAACQRLQGVVKEAVAFVGVVGVHHFSGSWLGLDGSKSKWLHDQAAQGVCTYFAARALFVEVCPKMRDTCSDCCDTGGAACSPLTFRERTWPIASRACRHVSSVVANQVQGLHMSDKVAQGIAGAQLANATAGERESDGRRPACSVISVVSGWSVAPSAAGAPEVSWSVVKDVMLMAAQEQCDVTIVTDVPQGLVMQALGNTTTTELVPRIIPYRLALVSDPYAPVPLISLTDMLRQWHWDRRAAKTPYQLRALHVSSPGSCVWEVISQLHVQDSQALRGPGAPSVLLLELGPLLPPHRHLMHSVYQHLVQEAGYSGYTWARQAERHDSSLPPRDQPNTTQQTFRGAATSSSRATAPSALNGISESQGNASSSVVGHTATPVGRYSNATISHRNTTSMGSKRGNIRAGESLGGPGSVPGGPRYDGPMADPRLLVACTDMSGQPPVTSGPPLPPPPCCLPWS